MIPFEKCVQRCDALLFVIMNIGDGASVVKW